MSGLSLETVASQFRNSVADSVVDPNLSGSEYGSRSEPTRRLNFKEEKIYKTIIEKISRKSFQK